MNKLKLIVAAILALFMLSACTSESEKLLSEVQTNIEAKEWQLALEGAQELIERYPDSQEVSSAKEYAALALFEGDLKPAFGNADWDRVAQISEEISSLAPESKTAANAISAVYEGQSKVLQARLTEAFRSGEWQTVIDLEAQLSEVKSHVTAPIKISTGSTGESPSSEASDVGTVKDMLTISRANLAAEAIDTALQNGNADEAMALFGDFPSGSQSEVKRLRNICKTQLEGFEKLDQIRKEYAAGNWKTVSNCKKTVDSVESSFADADIRMPALIAEVRGMIEQAAINYNAEQRDTYYKQMMDAYNAQDWKTAISKGTLLMGKAFEGSAAAEEAAVIVESAKAKQAEAKKAAARAIIRVTKVEVSGHDYAGGVSIYFNFINKSDKVIKRVNFGVQFYNAVDEVVTCEIARDYTNYCYKTGPYNPGQGLTDYSWSWGKYYNWDIKYAKLTSLNVEFMDGSSVYFDSEEIGYVQY